MEQDNGEEEGMKQQAHRTQPMSHKLLQNANQQFYPSASIDNDEDSQDLSEDM
jgi:hypothetical protein